MNITTPVLSCAIAALLALSATTHAAPIPILHPDTVNHPNLAIGIENIVVDGITYTATFHITDDIHTNTFNRIWDPNGDANYTDGYTGLAPVFYNNHAGAVSAYDQIALTLYTTLMTNDHFQSDGFIIPTKHPNDSNYFTALIDLHPELLFHSPLYETSFSKTATANTAFAWTTFTVTSIPEPTTFALLSLTTLPLLTRRNRAA